MYRHLDKLLSEPKKKLRTEINHVGAMGFDALNVVNTRKVTEEMFDRLLAENEKVYLKAAKQAYRKGAKTAEEAGFVGEEKNVDGSWLAALLIGYNLVTGYLYKKEAERKRLRLNEQILTAREYDSREMYNDSLRRTANLWWTQTLQYGIDVVDEATIQAYEDILTAREYADREMFDTSLRRTANLWWTQTVQYGISAVDKATIKAFRDKGVKEVRWVAADDEKTCSICNGRDGKIYKILKIPEKPHYGCRCYVVPVEIEE